MKKKSKALSVLLAICLITAMMPVSAFAEEIAADDIVILYTGDVHGGVSDNISLAGVSAYAKEKKAKTSYVEIVDAGDALSGTAIANASKGKYAVDAMNAAGYAIAVPGVHDFDFGVDRLVDELASAANYQYVSANFAYSAGTTTVFKPYKLATYGKVKIAYVGISDPETIEKSEASFKNSSGSDIYDFANGQNGKELYDVVQSAIDSAKNEGADYVVAIGHLSSTGTSVFTPKSVIQNTTGINAFIAGNSHTAISGEQVKNKDGTEVLLTSAGAALKNIGVLTLSPGKSVSSQLVSSYALRDIQTKDTIDALTDAYNAEMKGSFAVSHHKMIAADSDGVRLVGKTETNLGDLCADAYKAATDADIAFAEAREIQGELEVGDISYSDVVKVLPGNESISVVKVSGYNILDALEMASRLCPSNNEGFLQISGVTFDIQETVKSTVTLDTQGKFTGVQKDYRVTNVKVGGKDLDLMGSYTVAGTNELLSGDTGYTMFSEGTVVKANAAIDNQALSDYISRNLGGVIGDKYAKAQGRIDFIKLARQSEINAEIEAGITERMKNYSQEMDALRAQIELQKQVINMKSLTIKTTTAVKKSGSKRRMKVSWTVSDSTVSGLKFQVYKSQKKSSGYKKAFTTSKHTYTNTSGLKKGKTYYYKVRGYKYLSGKYYYTNWSNISYKKIS